MTSESERPLTEAEQRRLDHFNQVREALAAKGYQETFFTIGIVKANAYTMLAAIPVTIGVFLLFFLCNRHREGFGLTLGFGGMLGFLLVFLAAVVAHELIHGLTWACFAENGWKDIEFGFMVKYLTPYCTCAAPLKKGPYILGALMPLIVLGLIPTVISMFTGSFFLVLFGLVMILSAGGDVMIVLKLLRYKTGRLDILYYDHPTEAGGVIFER